MVLKQCDDDHKGDGGKQFHKTIHNDVDLAAVVAFDGAVNRTNKQVNRCDDDSQDEREAGAAGKTGIKVSAIGIRAKNMARLSNAILLYCRILPVTSQ